MAGQGVLSAIACLRQLTKWTATTSGDIYCAAMDNALTSRGALVGHLALTVPAIAGIFLVPLLGLRMFGPFKLVYYVVAGIALGWQWYLIALPRWAKWLTGKGAQPEEVDSLARRCGLAWPRNAAIGPFALHTTAAAVCGMHFGPWLLSRWYAWILPLTGMSSHMPTGNDYLQHFELASIVPALVVGYLLSRYFVRFAAYAWILPTVVLVYKLLTYAEPQASVLFAPAHSLTRFDYFFVIQRTMPTFTPGFGGVDPIRVAEQLDVVAPFYAGIAYSAGALVGTRSLLDRIVRGSSMQADPGAHQTEEQSELP
jgi:hypothetical protein